MHTLTIYYTVQNNGDGSASSNFFESEELAQWELELDNERFCDDSPCSLAFQSESPISLKNEVRTKEHAFIEYFFDQYGDGHPDDKANFVTQFFPKGLPVFTVKTIDVTNKDYLDNQVFANGVLVSTNFRRKEYSGQIFENRLNS